MIKSLKLSVLSAAILTLPFMIAFAQMGGMHTGGHFNPDSLTQVTLNGTAIIDSSMMYPMYFLDTDADGIANYHLNFGPWWYQPDSSGAKRPLSGITVKIKGGLWDYSMTALPMVVVYEVEGQFWRDPYDAFWNSMGHHEHNGGHHQGGCMGYAFGEIHDTLDFISTNGLAMVDSTFMFEQYFLDSDSDGTPNYSLNFGPPWYQPSSGARRPADSASVNIKGALLQTGRNFPMLIVLEIDGKQWRDSTGVHHNLAGQWIDRRMNRAQMITTPFDDNSWMRVSPGWHTGNMMMPSSMFCQILELNPLDLPYDGMPGAFAGYEIGVFSPDGGNGMWSGGCGGSMRFNSNVEYQMHYNDIQMMGFGIDENTITANYWDERSNSWNRVPGALLDPVTNTITFSENLISNFVVLSGQPLATSVRDASAPAVFELKQNYPNPFNPGTTIVFDLSENADVRVAVYDLRGRKLTELLNQQMISGSHTVQFDGTDYESGVYFYELKVGERSRVMKMELVK